MGTLQQAQKVHDLKAQVAEAEELLARAAHLLAKASDTAEELRPSAVGARVSSASCLRLRNATKSAKALKRDVQNARMYLNQDAVLGADHDFPGF